jgi:type VI protein secretion system component VasF
MEPLDRELANTRRRRVRDWIGPITDILICVVLILASVALFWFLQRMDSRSEELLRHIVAIRPPQ